MQESCYNNKRKEPAEKRINRIFETLKKREKQIEEMGKGEIEIHFSGDSLTMSIREFGI